MSALVDRRTGAAQLAAAFERLRPRRELAFMPYQTAGYPSLAASLDNLATLEQLGADILELGAPFSDPMADGPTIQFSSQSALATGVSLRQTLTALTQRAFTSPLVLMSYLNPLWALAGRATTGLDALFARCAESRIAGVIIPDLPLDEADEWLNAARRYGLALIFLLAPTSSEARIAAVAERSDAFIYAVSLTGVTGARGALSAALPAFLERIRRISDKPVVVGFGIAAAEQIRELRGRADGVVVASRIIEAMRRNEAWAPLARELKDATRS